MTFYFIATQPYIEKALNDKIYLDLDDAKNFCGWLNAASDDRYGFWRVWQAEAVNIREATVEDVTR